MPEMANRGTPGAPWLVEPGRPLDLASRSPKSTDGAPGGDKAGARAAADELRNRLAELQERLWAEGSQSLLVVLQAIDAGGKDGTIKKVFEGVNPQGCKVVSFKRPTEEELAHDFLWRVHQEAPAHGEIGIFNRSHYEDVLVVRVHGLVPEAVWRARYDQINDFEAILAAGGTRMVKLFLHISKEEQAERFRARLKNPSKHWKFNPDDLRERDRWDDYQEAFREAMQRTSTDVAPWYVVPADHKWFRNWVVLSILVETLEEMSPQFPAPEHDVAGVVVG